jgi:DNA primase
VRHGEEVIFDNVETEDGQTISLTVAEYIDFDLGQDEIQFVSPLGNQILAEAVARSKDPNFKAETYFCSNPDIEVSRFATSLAIDRHQLGGRFAYEDNSDSLRQRVQHLVANLRLDILENQLKSIQQQIRQASTDMKRTMQLLTSYKELQELRNIFAKKLGRDIVM